MGIAIAVISLATAWIERRIIRYGWLTDDFPNGVKSALAGGSTHPNANWGLIDADGTSSVS